MRNVQDIEKKKDALKTVITAVFFFAVLQPLFSAGAMMKDSDSDIYCFNPAYINKLKSGQYADNIITGQLPPGSVNLIQINVFFAGVTVRSEAEGTSITYIVKGLPDEAVKIKQSASAFTLIEKRLKKKYSGFIDSKDWMKHIHIEIIVPEKMEKTDISIASNYNAASVSDFTCKTLSVDSGIGTISVDAVRCGVLNADTGSGAISFSNIVCKTGGFDTGSGNIVLTDCTITEKALFNTGSGSVHCSGNGYIKNPQFDTGSGGIRFKTRVEGSIYIDTGSGSVYLDLNNSTVEHLAADTGSGNIELVNLLCKNGVFDTGSGNIIFSGIIAGDCTLDIGSGSVSMHLQTGPEDYGICIKDRCIYNNVNINGTERSNGFMLGNENSKYIISVDTASGAFNIDFKDGKS